MTSASADDGATAPRVLAKLDRESFPRLARLWVDNKYHNHALYEWVAEHGIDAPIIAAVAAMIAGQLTVDQAVEGLVRRPLRAYPAEPIVVDASTVTEEQMAGTDSLHQTPRVYEHQCRPMVLNLFNDFIVDRRPNILADDRPQLLIGNLDAKL